MRFEEKYTTVSKREEINADKNINPEEKDKENEKIVVSNDAFLHAEMAENLINKLEQLRISGLTRR